MLTADVDGNGRDDIVVDFPGFDVWVYRNNAVRTQLHPLSTEHLVLGDRDATGDDRPLPQRTPPRPVRIA